MLYSMHYFMGRAITYSDDSSTRISHNLKKPSLKLWNSDLISPLLNRQIKFAMHKLRVETTKDIFDDFEKQLKTRKKEVWATCFSVIVILCMCMEEAQIAVNLLFVHKRTYEPKEVPPTKEVMDIYRNLDDYPFRHLTELFHATFKTQKKSLYNPIRDGLGADGDGAILQDSVELVNEVRQIKRYYGTC